MTQPNGQDSLPPALLVVAPTWRELGGLRSGRMGLALAAEVGMGQTAPITLAGLLDQAPPQLILSLGFAGAAAGGIASGRVVVCTSFLSALDKADAPIEADIELAEMAKSQMPRAITGSLVTVPAPLLTPAEKQLTGAETGAVVVDMEGYSMAKVAQEHGVPFLALRAVLDPVGRRLPSFVADIITDQGKNNEWRHTLRALFKRPYQLPNFILLGLDYRRAKMSLYQTLLDIRPGLAAHLEEREE